MTNTRQVVLRVSPVLYGRMELRAREQRHDMHEWVLRAVIGELLRLENDEPRHAQEALAALASASISRPTNERKPHAAHS